MAPVAPSDPPLNVREKGSRIVVVFNVANVRPNSVQVEARAPSEDEPSGSVHVSFNSVSPNRSFEKHLVLPYAIDGKTVKDVQSKSLTVQLVKLDETQEWGQAWLKPKGKAKRKESHEAVKTDLEGKTKIEAVVEEAESKAPQEEEGSQKDELKEEACEEKEQIDEPRSKEVEEPEKETELPKETKEEVEETVPVADTTLTESTGEEHKAGVKARARRGKKSKVNKEKVEEHVVEEVKEEKEVQKETPSRPEKTETAKQKAKQKAKKGETAAKPASEVPEVLQDTRTRDALLQALKQSSSSPTTPGANDIPVPPPTDPELHRLVSQGTSLLRSDSKKAVVLLRLAGRKGYLPAYLLLAQHAQRTQDDTLLIESLCALFTSPDLRKQLPHNVLSNIVMQLTAVLRDPKNQREAEAHAADIEQIAKDWPIMNMLKLPAGDNKSKIPSSPSPVKESPSKGGKSEAKAKTQDFQEIKRAMATCRQDTKDSTNPPKKDEDVVVAGTWRQEGGRWCLSIQAAPKEDLSTAELDISSRDLYLRAKGKILTKLSTPENLDLSQVEASWSKKTRSLEVVAASKKVQEVPNCRKPTRHIDELD